MAWVDRGYFAHLARRAGFPRIAVDVDEVETILRRRNHALSPKSANDTNGTGPRDLAWHERLELAKLERYEKSLSGKFWRVLVCKEDDRQFLGDPRGNVHVVPNGIPIYGPHAPEREAPGRLMFVGAMDYAPNDDAASWFATAILPRVRAADPAAHFVAAIVIHRDRAIHVRRHRHNRRARFFECRAVRIADINRFELAARRIN